MVSISRIHFEFGLSSAHFFVHNTNKSLNCNTCDQLLTFFVLVCFYLLIISPYQLVLGLNELSSDLHTWCVLSSLVRWGVISKWTHPFSGKMK